MFCHVCGTKIEDGSLYCEACGAKQIGISEKQVDVSSNYPTATKEVSKKENEPKTTVPKKNKGKKTVIICAIAAAAVLIVGGIVTFFIIRGRNSSGSPVGAPSGRIRVLYGDGDYSESVINDLTLPKKVDGVKVKWSSDKPDVISNKGKVTRPEDSNQKVTLTATFKNGKDKTSKEFTVNVIKNKNINTDEMDEYSIDDIDSMNEDNPYYFTEYNNVEITTKDEETGDDKTVIPISAICGKFSDITIESSEDAIAALYNINDILALNDPKTELRPLVVNHSEYGRGYTFNQVYKGLDVYGRHLTVSCDVDGAVTSVTSSCYSLDGVFDVDTEPSTSVKKASKDIKASYEVEGIETKYVKSIIYNLDEYEEKPVMAYLFLANMGGFISDTVIYNALDGEIICKGSNIQDASVTGKGKNEKGEEVSFPMHIKWNSPVTCKKYMYDLDRGIRIIKVTQKGDDYYGDDYYGDTDDATAVSAYTNIIRVYDWYNGSDYDEKKGTSGLGRNSVDGNGMAIPIMVYGSDAPRKDNASWDGSGIHFYPNSEKNKDKNPITLASCLDVCGHEFTHGVVGNITGGGLNEVHTKCYITSAINEAYADIFGWFIDYDDNLIMEEWSTEKGLCRSLENPNAYEEPSRFMDDEFWYEYDISEDKYKQWKKDRISNQVNNKNNVNYEDVSYDAFKKHEKSWYEHQNCTVISHAAYLMSVGNEEHSPIEKEKLIKLWYNSLDKNYDASSRFIDVRIKVLIAASDMEMSSSEMDTIKWAFDEVNIIGTIHHEKADEDKLYKDYIINVLIPEHGVYDPAQNAYLSTPQLYEYKYTYNEAEKKLDRESKDVGATGEYDEGNVGEYGPKLCGLIYTEIGDFDDDGSKELLVIRGDENVMSQDVYSKRYPIIVEIYTIVDSVVTLVNNTTVEIWDETYMKERWAGYGVDPYPDYEAKSKGYIDNMYISTIDGERVITMTRGGWFDTTADICGIVIPVKSLVPRTVYFYYADANYPSEYYVIDKSTGEVVKESFAIDTSDYDLNDETMIRRKWFGDDHTDLFDCYGGVLNDFLLEYWHGSGNDEEEKEDIQDADDDSYTAAGDALFAGFLSDFTDKVQNSSGEYFVPGKEDSMNDCYISIDEIKDFYNDGSLQYTYTDMDGDNVPELLLGYPDSELERGTIEACALIAKDGDSYKIVKYCWSGQFVSEYHGGGFFSEGYTMSAGAEYVSYFEKYNGDAKEMETYVSLHARLNMETSEYDYAFTIGDEYYDDPYSEPVVPHGDEAKSKFEEVQNDIHKYIGEIEKMKWKKLSDF